MNGPDLMVVDEFTVHVDRAVGEAVGALVDHPIGLQKAAVIDFPALRIDD